MVLLSFSGTCRELVFVSLGFRTYLASMLRSSSPQCGGGLVRAILWFSDAARYACYRWRCSEQTGVSVSGAATALAAAGRAMILRLATSVLRVQCFLTQRESEYSACLHSLRHPVPQFFASCFIMGSEGAARHPTCLTEGGVERASVAMPVMAQRTFQPTKITK